MTILAGVSAFSQLKGRLDELIKDEIQEKRKEALAEIQNTKELVLNDLRKHVADSEDMVKSNALPVGTVIASLLDPEEFRDSSGGGWVLCDGANIIGTPLSSIIKTDSLPDLRGVFLRGLNVGRSDGRQDPDGDKRKVGDFQNDIFKNHDHGYILRSIGTHNDGGGRHSRINPGGEQRTTKVGSAETRPKNVSVYYYIKVE